MQTLQSDETRIIHNSLEFPGFWRVVWFGGVQLVNSPWDTPKVRVFLAPLKEEPGHCRGSDAVRGTPRSALIALGEACRLYLNAVLHDGEIVEPWGRHLPSERLCRSQRLDFSKSNLQIIRRDHRSEGQWVFPPGRRVLPREPGSGGYLLAVRAGDDPFAILIPCFEISRFFYMLSSRLANLLLTPAFLSPYEELFCPRRTRIDRSDGRMFIYLRKRMLDDDAAFVAWLASDPLFLERAAEIFLRASTTDYGQGIKQVAALPPCDGRVGIAYLFHQFVGQRRKRRIVSRLLHADWAPPYSELEYERENSNQKGEEVAPDAEPANWPNNRERGDLDPTEQKEKRLTDGKPSPNRALGRAWIGRADERFPALAGIPVTKCDKTIQHYLGSGQAPPAPPAEGSSVSDGTSVHSDLEPLVISLAQRYVPPKAALADGEFADPLKAEEDRLGRVIRLLERIDAGSQASVRFLDPTGTSVRLCDALAFAFAAFPRRSAPEGATHVGAWFFSDRAETKLRLFVLAELCRRSDGVHRYVLDTQERLGTGHSMLIFGSDSGAQLQEGTLRCLVADCADASRLRPSNAWAAIRYRARHHTEWFLDRCSTESALDQIFRPLPPERGERRSSK